MTHGLVGSQEWWAQIKSGDLPLHSVQGIVSGFWPGQNDTGPAEFEVREADGKTSRWLCGAEPNVARNHFRRGRWVIVQYVCQQLKTAFEGCHETRITISICLGE
jgi:hypothetical protein